MSIRQAGSRFAPDLENIAELGNPGCVGNPVDSMESASNRPRRVELSPFVSIRQARSRFAQDLENTAEVGNAGCVGNVVDSTRFD